MWTFEVKTLNSFSSLKTLTKCLCSTGLIKVRQYCIRMVCELLLPSGCRPAVFPHSEGRSVTAGLGVSGRCAGKHGREAKPSLSAEVLMLPHCLPGQHNPLPHCKHDRCGRLRHANYPRINALLLLWLFLAIVSLFLESVSGGPSTCGVGIRYQLI